MAYNIEWACPEITECWSYRGRLYRTYKKAEIEFAHWQSLKEKYSITSEYWRNLEMPQIYHIKWEWEGVDG